MTEMAPLRAVLWCAVSTKAQAEDDKDSLPRQEAVERELCKKNGWQITAVLKVPGHSRRYTDIHELAADARAENIDAFDRILDLWKRKAFDVLICRDGKRFARTQTLHARFAEDTIDIGARIYAYDGGGWVDETNYRMWTAMGGFSAAGDVDALVKARSFGMAKRMERGLNGGLVVPDPYRLVRDENGKPLRLEFREEYRRMMDDAATLLLEGVGWKKFSIELYERFGHANPKNNKPFHDNTFHRWFHNPYFWGITAMNYANRNGVWVFDENEPLPEGVKVNRHPNPPIPPVWDGETAELIKAELRRRLSVVKGRAAPRTKYAFTGLFVCASCGRRFGFDAIKGNNMYWRCSAHTYRHYHIGEACTNRRLLRDDIAKEQINEFLTRALAQAPFNFALLTNASGEVERQRKNAEALRTDIARLQTEIDTMIINQSKAPLSVQTNYAKQIESASRGLATLESALRRSEASLESSTVRNARQIAYKQLISTGLDAFWQCTPVEINQALHGFMGKYHFIVQDGEIIEVR